LWVEYSPNSLTIRFKRANPDIIFKYSLSGEILYVEGERREYSHIYIMDSVTEDLINNFIEDLKAEDAFPEQDLYPELQQSAGSYEGKRGVFVPQTGRGFK